MALIKLILLWITLLGREGYAQKMFDVEGIVAPVYTPMDNKGNINLKVIPLYMDYLDKHNVSGVLVGGTSGEAMSLSVEERKALLGAWISAAKPLGRKVIAQVGGAPLPHVLDLAKHAEQLQVDGILTLPELYFKPKSVEKLVAYLKTVSDAAPMTPLLYYHYPKMSGVDVNMRQLFSLASSTIPNFKGAKADLGTADEVSDYLGVDQRIFIASHHIAPSVLMGHESSIATVSNIFPDLVRDIVDSVKNADVKKAKLLQRKLNRLVNNINTQGEFVPHMKAAMELVTNISVGPPRFPLTPLNDTQITTLKNLLSTLNV